MDDAVTRIEQALGAALAAGEAGGCPPRLAAAVRYAVFPGGARIRPRLCLAVAAACGEDDPTLADCAAAAIELLHCASLVHDDLPCFDDAPLRRGKPSVHRAFGERLAVLAGDALIVLRLPDARAGRDALAAPPGARSSRVIGRAVGMPAGIVAGQAWECEPRVSLAEYQRAKTGALFAAATVAGAVAAGADPTPGARWASGWARPTRWPTTSATWPANADDLGKPIGRDAALGRPSAAGELGLAGAIQRLEHLVAGAIESIPPCAGAA